MNIIHYIILAFLFFNVVNLYAGMRVCIKKDGSQSYSNIPCNQLNEDGTIKKNTYNKIFLSKPKPKVTKKVKKFYEMDPEKRDYSKLYDKVVKINHGIYSGPKMHYINKGSIYYMIDASSEKYFYNDIKGNIYKYIIDGYAGDNSSSKYLIIKQLSKAFMNERVYPEIKKAIKLKRRGYCITSRQWGTGYPGPTFAIEFHAENGRIRGFIVGSALPFTCYLN